MGKRGQEQVFVVKLITDAPFQLFQDGGNLGI
jgi:hypothetical protein